ncbi:MAG: hypothetical protein AB7F35_25415 [Acetobacteraceae bacterium]|uniref:hypothetical protein n=1 Tax=Bradyrhizobium sp. TaxID=376 RepID=UPI003D14EB74
MGRWLDAFRRGQAAGYAHYGGETPPAEEDRTKDENRPGEWDLEPEPDDPDAPEDDTWSDEDAEKLQARLAELEAKSRDDAQRLAELNGEIGRLTADIVGKKQLIDDLTEGTADLRTALQELEAISMLLVEVLAKPGVKKWLQQRFHPDKYPDASEAQRRSYEETAAQINAAYDIVAECMARQQEMAAEG